MAYIYDLVDSWNSAGTTFTAIKMNVTDTASSSSSLLIDLQVGTVSKFLVAKTGRIDIRGDLRSYGTGAGIRALSDTSYFSIGVNDDVLLTRRAAANIRLGAADAATPVAQILSVQSVVAGTSNTAGANWTFTGSQGTGTGAGGSIIFQVASAGSTGSTQNALTTALTIDSTGKVAVAGLGSSANPSLQIGASSTTGFMSNGSGFISFTGTNGIYATFNNGGGLRVAANVPLEWSNTAGNSALTGDLQLWRDDANILAQRNSTNAQTYRLYGTYTDASNYERLRFSFPASGPATIVSESAGTGAARPLTLAATGSAYIQFATGATDRWYINSSGHFLSNLDNTYDIGASGANRPRNVYVGTNIISPQFSTNAFGFFTTSGGFIGFAARAGFESPADGVIKLRNAADTDFNRLQFGGTTSSFPALKRSGAALQVRLADDTADAAISASTFTASSSAVNISALASTGYSLTGSSTVSMVDLAGTWNTTGAPTGIKMNVTDVASSNSSLLMDLQTNGSSRFKVAKDGAIEARTITTTSSSVNLSAISSTGHSLTGSSAVSMVDLAGTWNTSGTPTAFKMNIINTASNAASLLMDLQVDGNSKFKVRKDSVIEIPETTAPGVATANSVRIYAEDNGSGKTRLMAQFASGAAVQIAIEP